ncbi:MAG: aquaporin [Ilumatobacter sp.]|nr:aquaporin [Ilumatobacter sp.]
MGDSVDLRNVFAEFVGTVLVMLAGPGLLVLAGDSVGTVGVAIGFGAATALAIGAIGAVANPMFSLALFFSRGITGHQLVTDLIGQVLGGIVGAAFIWGMNDADRFSVGSNGWETTSDVGVQLTGFSTLGTVIAAELVIGIMITVVLLSTISQGRSESAIAAFAGLAVGVGALILVPISGFGANPARSIGAAIFADTDPNALGQVWVFVIVPLIASFGGMLVWLGIDDATVDDTVFDDTILDDAADAIDELVDGD